MHNPVLKLIGDQPKVFNLGDFMTLGKDTQCQIYIDNSQIAERHARIERRDDYYYIRDLRTQVGTFVNDARIMEAYLQDGDIIKLGGAELQFIRDPLDENHFPLSSKNLIWNEQLQMLGNVSKTNFPVLLLGPSGTGKDIIAQNIHAMSSRSRGPLICVNCSALNETLIESELFGHTKGSFTGAIGDRKGAFEAARGGTLFLDEIGDLPYNLQAKLLRALENNEIRPLGADKSLKADVRVIAATHQNLEEKIKSGAFRQDLFFRLNVIAVNLPQLQHRMEDFDDLVYGLAKVMRVRFSHGAILKLKKHDWPGNIRELKNLVSRASALYPKELVTEGHVDKLLNKSEIIGITEKKQTHLIKEIEKNMILKYLTKYRGNQRRAAMEMGMPKSTLHDKVKQYSIDLPALKTT